jgi:hypothetical protein
MRMVSGWMEEQAEERRSPLRRRSWRLSALASTTMLPSLPPELLDLVVHHLRDEPTTLKACCVVSKPWIHRTRTHLFACVEFYARKSHTELWKKRFPDPSTSPAHHTRSLSIRGIPPITTTDTDAGDWISTFHNIVHLHLESGGSEDSLIPFYGLSPTLRSLRLTTTPVEVLDLICSFPLLEDLMLLSLGPGSDSWNTPSTSPKLTGTLALRTFGGVWPVVRRLLDLPDGLHFTKITTACFAEDVKATTGLVSRCSDTLESLSVYCYMMGAFPSVSTSGQ